MSICKESLSGVELSLWLSADIITVVGEGVRLPDFDRMEWLGDGDGVREPSAKKTTV